MFEAELEAVRDAFRSADLLAESNNGPICQYIIIITDNLEVQQKLVTLILDRDGSGLEGLLSGSDRVRGMLVEIRAQVTKYHSVQIEWQKAHTGGSSVDARGNDRADQLAKKGLREAFEGIQDLI